MSPARASLSLSLSKGWIGFSIQSSIHFANCKSLFHMLALEIIANDLGNSIFTATYSSHSSYTLSLYPLKRKSLEWTLIQDRIFMLKFFPFSLNPQLSLENTTWVFFKIHSLFMCWSPLIFRSSRIWDFLLNSQTIFGFFCDLIFENSVFCYLWDNMQSDQRKKVWFFQFFCCVN